MLLGRHRPPLPQPNRTVHTAGCQHRPIGTECDGCHRTTVPQRVKQTPSVLVQSYLPHSDRAVAAARDEIAPIWTKRQGVHLISVYELDRPCSLASLPLPKMRAIVGAAGGDKLVIRAKGHRLYRSVVSQASTAPPCTFFSGS
jgi:hypothetical protein